MVYLSCACSLVWKVKLAVLRYHTKLSYGEIQCQRRLQRQIFSKARCFASYKL